MNTFLLKREIEHFLHEDLQFGDLSADTIFPEDVTRTGIIIAKADGIFAGEAVIHTTFQLLSQQANIIVHKKDGEAIQVGDLIATITAPIRTLLTAERTALNIIQRMSGIATITNEAVNALNSEKTRICDTRKTTPGLRLFEKYAVNCGGGFNHRQSVNDGVMIKDNHITYCGSITEAVQQAKSKIGPMVKIEVETETLEQVKEAVAAKADIIMFDNRTPEEIGEFLQHVPATIMTEASGGITLDTIHQYKDTGVDYISLGFLTYGYHALDMSMLVEGGNKQ